MTFSFFFVNLRSSWARGATLHCRICEKTAVVALFILISIVRSPSRKTKHSTVRIQWLAYNQSDIPALRFIAPWGYKIFYFIFHIKSFCFDSHRSARSPSHWMAKHNTVGIQWPAYYQEWYNGKKSLCQNSTQIPKKIFLCRNLNTRNTKNNVITSWIG